MFKKNWQKIFLTVLLGIILFAPVVLANGILPSETGVVTNPAAKAYCDEYLQTHPGGNCGNYTLDDFVALAITIAKWILGVVGAVALLFLVYGGFTLILSGGNEDRVRQGKEILTGAIIGLIIVFTAYLIIQFTLTLLGAPGANGGVFDFKKIINSLK
ncbi:MAG TPA: pilin [Candidatus Methylomirabilis sp.]|nr:pilin [Candidatus Methylomirabilis sp.]